MPIYEYICRQCGCEFEKLVPRSGTPVECEQCGSSDVEKQFSVFSAAADSGAALLLFLLADRMGIYLVRGKMEQILYRFLLSAF